MFTVRFDSRSIVLVGLVLIITGAFLPWVNLPAFLGGELARWGLTGGGFLTLALGVLGLVSWLWPWPILGFTALPAALLAALSNGVTLLALILVLKDLNSFSLPLSAYPAAIGGGLYMTFAGGVLVCVAGLWPATQAPADRPAAPASTDPSGWAEPGARRIAPLGALALVALAGLCSLACLCAVLTGVLLGPVRSTLRPQGTFTAVSATPELYLLATPLIDVQVTWLGMTPSAPAALTPVKAIPTTPAPTASPTHPVVIVPSAAPTLPLTPPGQAGPGAPMLILPSATPTAWPALTPWPPTPTSTALAPVSPLATPGAGSTGSGAP